MARRPKKEPVRIAAVSDNTASMERMRQRIEALSGQFLATESAAEVCQAAGKLKPHLVFVDMNSPHLRSLRIVQELIGAEETCDTPIVGLCGHLEADRQRAALEAGCVGVASHAEAISRLKDLILELTGNDRVNIP